MFILENKPDSLIIPDDIQLELDDEAYTGRLHYCSATYDDGCRGPLCRMQNRDAGRRNSMRKAVKKGESYTPLYKLREYLTPINRDEVLYQLALLQRDQILLARRQASKDTQVAYQAAYRKTQRELKKAALETFNEEFAQPA